jgi:cytosine/adenosine deaminase-related metal-dependent hydrolase
MLRARIVVPVCQAPISNGAVLVNGSKVAAVGPWQGLKRRRYDQLLDLGDAIILPGLVNAHCHLDYTNMAGQLAPPKHFADWLKGITDVKAGWTRTDYAESWLNGAQMLLSSGTTTVADVEAVPELLPELWNATPIRVISFMEMIGITGKRKPGAILKEAIDKIASLGIKGRAGLSPHATYSTLPALLRLAASAARKNRWRVVTHVAESASEFEMFTQAKGEMFDWLKKSRDMSDCRGRSPIEHLHECGLLSKNLLAVHANYLQDSDVPLLSRYKVNVVHCPRSHFYFRHSPFPLNRLLDSRVNVCLGTDSLASVYKVGRQSVQLDMFQEMRSLASAHPGVEPAKILEMATLNGALALGLINRIGQISRGSLADLIVLSGGGRIAEVHETILAHSGNVAASMIEGKWAIAPLLN